MIRTLAVAGYRSLRDLRVPLGQLTVVTGANGSGKSNLYRALRLLAEIAQGGALRAIAREGGFESVLWAGLEEPTAAHRSGALDVQGTARKGRVSVRLGFSGDAPGYAVDLGVPPERLSAFDHDPELKRELIWHGPVYRASTLVADRRGPSVRARGAGEDTWAVLASDLATFDSMMTHAADPARAPEILAVRERLRGWRFYDQLRVDADAPGRHPQVGTHTPVLASDGADLAAALQTILEIGDARGLRASVADAFPGASLGVDVSGTRFEVQLQQHGLLRPLRAAELSDGTLRYLMWIAALSSPRPPELLVLNEPESSLHLDLIPALGRLITRAATHGQIVLVTHSGALVAALPEAHVVQLEKVLGETQVAGLARLDRPPWQWPSR